MTSPIDPNTGKALRDPNALPAFVSDRTRRNLSRQRQSERARFHDLCGPVREYRVSDVGALPPMTTVRGSTPERTPRRTPERTPRPLEGDELTQALEASARRCEEIAAKRESDLRERQSSIRRQTEEQAAECLAQFPQTPTEWATWTNLEAAGKSVSQLRPPLRKAIVRRLTHVVAQIDQEQARRNVLTVLRYATPEPMR